MTRKQAAAYYGAQIALSALLLGLLVPFGEWPLRVPFDYRGDGVIHAALVKGIAEEGPLHLTRIGAPFGADIVDWPIGMWLPLGVTSVLVRITGHPGTAMNLYWLLTIALTGLSATWVLRRLGLGSAPGFVFGLLYAFLPYVFYRNTAHFGTMYPLIPLVALLALRVAGTAPERLDRRERWVTLAACLAQGLSYVYYAFFGCLLLGGAGLLAWFRTRRLRLPCLAATGILLLALGTAIPLVPSFAYWHRHGRNERLSYKTVADAEVYGLKLRHLITPIDDHPLGVLRQVAARIRDADFPDENENTTARLGLIGSLGFLALLAYALARAAGTVDPDEQIGPAATLTLIALLIAQVGGVGSIFSVFVTPDIRGYNRIVVFIAFFSLHASGMLLSRGLARLPKRPTLSWSGTAIVVALCAFGIMDQVPRQFLARVRSDTAPQFAEDEAFVSLVESRLPPGAMVFQLPHATIPLDLGSRPPMMTYDPGRAYVSSRSLRWSWGSVLGRTGDWQTQTSKMSPVAMARRLVLAGFAGIWIDRWGYPEPGRLGWPTLESALAAAADSAVSASSGGRYSFLALGALRERVEAELGHEAFAAARAEVLGDFVLFPRWREGCSDEGGDVQEPSRVCGRHAWAIVKNDDTRERRLVLQARVRAFRTGRLGIRVGEWRDELAVAGQPVTYRREVVIPGARRLRIDLAFEGECEVADGPLHCVEVFDMKAVPAGIPTGDGL
jgi:hypothetical protein